MLSAGAGPEQRASTPTPKVTSSRSARTRSRRSACRSGPRRTVASPATTPQMAAVSPGRLRQHAEQKHAQQRAERNRRRSSAPPAAPTCDLRAPIRDRQQHHAPADRRPARDASSTAPRSSALAARAQKIHHGGGRQRVQRGAEVRHGGRQNRRDDQPGHAEPAGCSR